LRTEIERLIEPISHARQAALTAIDMITHKFPL